MNFVLFADNTTTTSSDGVFDGVNDFFHSDTWSVIWKLGLLFVIVFWLASAYWVYKDARRRIDDPWLVAMATLLGLVPPFIGPLVYLFFRPPEYLEDVRERELGLRAMEEQLGARVSHCPVCRAAVEPEYLVCPVCTTKLKQACVTCKAPLEPLWQVCPFCETPIVRRSSVFDEAVSPDTLHEPLRLPRRGAAPEPDPAENLTGDQSTRPAMAVERTLVLIKPDAVKRGLAGEILRRFEARGLAMRAARLLTVDRRLAEQHYAEHAEKPFFGELVDFITSAPTLALVLEGEGAIAVVRSTMGSTNPADSGPGTIRGDLALSMPDNLVHGSDSPESAAREVALWFGDDGVV